MKRVFVLSLAVALTMAMVTTAVAKPASGPGKVQVGVDASVWDSTLPPGPGIDPVGGAGQINGEFTVAERLGIQIGLRAQERFVGPLEATPNKNKKIGIYEADAGISPPGLLPPFNVPSLWNLDVHVDLRGAHGVAAGTTMSDYDLTLESNLFPLLAGPVDVVVVGAIAGDTVLYQESSNPGFGAFFTGFDATVAGTYNIRLVLTPKTFNNPPLAVEIQVDVS